MKTFIILMMDFSHTFQASTVLNILHLTLIAFLNNGALFFLTSRVSFYAVELNTEGVRKLDRSQPKVLYLQG